MKLYDYLEKLIIPFGSRCTILSLITKFPNTSQNQRCLTYSGYCNVAKMYEIPDDYKLPENYLDLMVTVNQMVKDPSCPNNFRNRFYDYKGRIIKQVIKEGRVSDVYDEGSCISLVVDGKYKFHQLKNSYAGTNLVPIGVREYVHEDTAIPFDEDTFIRFQIAAVYYLGKARSQKYGTFGEPKCCKDKKTKEEKDTTSYDDKTIPLGYFLHCLDIPFSTKTAIATILVEGDTRTLNREEYNNLIYGRRIKKGYTISTTNLIDLMVEVNKMVKDENCPKNLKNRFYRHKKQIIHAYADDRKISEVWEERDCWSLLLDGKYWVHQPKHDHPRGYPKLLKGTRDFVGEETIPFDMEKYNQFQLAALYFLGKRSVKLEEALLY